MQMAADPNLNFGVFPQSFCNQRVVSFQTGAVNGGSGGIPGCLDSSSGISATLGMTSDASSMILPSNSPSMLVDPRQSLKYAAPLSVDWSYQELAILKDGLDNHAHEPSIMKYIKIASRLPEKTVRDVAMRCQWMMKENTRRRKPEEYHAGKKIKDRKDKLVDSSLWVMNSHGQTETKASVPFTMRNANYANQFQCGASEIDTAMRSVLEENAGLLSQISAKLAACQTRNNIDLFNRTRSNIQALLDSMNQMPGIMSKMPLLPVSIDERLASYLLHGTTMAPLLGNSHLKEEPRGGW